MKTTLARRYAVLIACAGLGFSVPAFAQDKTAKIGVLNDMSSLYADIGGPNSVAAIKNAVLLNSGAATADLTGKACTPNTISFTYDTYMLANGTGKALTKAGGDSW